MFEIEPFAKSQTVGPPSLVTDAENFHVPLGLTEVLLDAVYHDIGELFPPPSVVALNAIVLHLLNDLTTFPIPVLSTTILMSPNVCIVDDVFGNPFLSSLSTVQPGAFVDADTERCYGVSSTMIVFPLLVGHTDFICSASISVGSVGMIPALVEADDDVVAFEVDSSYRLMTSGVPSDEMAGASAVLLMIQYLTPTIHVDVEDTLDPDGVAAFGHLMPELGVMDGDVVAAAVMVPGDAGLSPDCIDENEIQYQHDLQATVALSASLVTDADQAHDANALPGDILWQDPDNLHDDEFAGSSMLPGPVGMQSDWFGDTDLLYASVCARGDANVGPFPYEVVDVIFAAASQQISNFTMPRYTDRDRVPSPRISGGHYHSTQGSRLAGSMSGPAYMVGGMNQHSLKGSIAA